MKQAAREALAGNKSEYEKIKGTARAYAKKRECYVQEAVYIYYNALTLVAQNISSRNIFEQQYT